MFPFSTEAVPLSSQVEAGSFQRADAEVLKQRKIVKARRNPAAATTTTPNPFANIKLAPGATIAPPAANPSASTTLAPPPKPEDRNEEEVKERLTTNGAAAAATEVEKEKPGEQPSTKPSGFGAFAASSGGLLFGSSKSTGGFRGFSGDAVAGSAAIGGGAGIFGFGSASTTAAAGAAPSVFGSTKSVGFGALSSAGTGTGGTTGIFGVGGGAITTAAAAGPATGEGEEEEKEKEEAPAAPAPNNVFGATTTTTTTITNTRNTPSAALPEEQPAATGEEHEDVVYSVDGVLFEFDLVEKAWKERGRGEVRVLVHSATSAGRVVMRQKGNLRLLLNANLWKEMHLNRMDGGKGVTFAVVNHALVGDGEENGGGGGGPLATYAFRVKTEDLLEKFIEAVDSHKGGRLINV